MSDDELAQMSAAVYRPKDGARGIVGFINDFMDAQLSNTILETPDSKGVMTISYDEKNEVMSISAPVMKELDTLASVKE